VDRDGRRDLLRRAEQIAVEGRRVLLLAHSARPLDGERPPAGLEPRAMVVIGDQVRGDAADTVAWFAAEGVQVKVVSGDHPRTVGAIAAQVGIAGADRPVDARSLPDGQAALAELLEARSVFGRVVPRQKREMVDALGARGHVVAMTGDGVNDVLALKDADLGIAMGSGSAASRAVAELVLMDGRFATLPAVMAEGRRVIANIERVAKLFVTKTVYATVLALAVGMAGLAFPFLPRHLTLISSLTIGIPGFFLALEPNTQRSRPGFVRRTLAFAVPAGLAAALGTLAAYQVADVADVPQDQARTTATLALAGLGLVVLALAARPLNHLRRLLLAAMAAAFAVVLLVPFLRAFFALDLPPLPVALTALALVAAVGGLLTLVVLRLRL
jgi:magnesium-transporting ATPase (P-type)